jgi:hypothetical protein
MTHDDDFDNEHENRTTQKNERNDSNLATSQSIEEIRDAIQQLRKKRQDHLDAAREIEQSLMQFRNDVLDIDEDHQESDSGRDRNNGKIGMPPKRRGRPRKNDNNDNDESDTRSDGRSRRNGNETGTSIIESILSENGNEMSSSDLASQAKDKGVKYPHSAFQSLKKRGRIEVENHMIRLVSE